MWYNTLWYFLCREVDLVKKGGLVALLAALLALVLTGCGLTSPEALYTLPKPSTEYESLQESLELLLDNGYEYSPPIAGSNTQSVQLRDLNGDGVDEAVAFLRDSSGKERPLKICILSADEEKGYTLACMIEGDGDMINSVAYCQLNGTPTEEIVVGWRISDTVYALSAYSVENGNVTELMTAPSYTKYEVDDLDQDNQAEIVSIQLSSAEEGGNTATYYDWSEDTMMSINTVSLSNTADSLQSVQYNYLVGSYPALYVNSYQRNDSASLVTDVLSVVDKKLTNITMDSAAGNSATSHLYLTDAKDINSDNVLELPMPVPLRSNGNVEGSDSVYVINWIQFTLEGTSQSVGYTYHNTADGWYLSLPENWFTGPQDGYMTGLVLSRSDTNVGATVERSITFYHQEGLSSQPQPFLTIYKNTGTNRESRATMGERFLLAQDEEATYSAEFLDGWSCGLNSGMLAERFKLIVVNWSTD